MMKNKKVHIPKLKSYYVNKDIRCERCGNKMLAGGQYYGAHKVWLDFTCIGCSRGVDIDLASFNAIMTEFNFKKRIARYVVPE